MYMEPENKNENNLVTSKAVVEFDDPLEKKKKELTLAEIKKVDASVTDLKDAANKGFSFGHHNDSEGNTVIEVYRPVAVKKFRVKEANTLEAI